MSVNVAITNLVMDAVNAAYRVVLPGTQLPGFLPPTRTPSSTTPLSLLATVTTTDELLAVWR